MTDTLAKEIDCVLCGEAYSPVIQPEEGEGAYRIYCSHCTNWLSVGGAHPVRVTLREVLGVKEEALALALQTYLAPCHCGGEFSHDAGKRCPACLQKIEAETPDGDVNKSQDFFCPWNLEELKKLEPKIFDYIFESVEGKEETLTDLIQRFEGGEIDDETYMEGVERLQLRESSQICVIQTWAMVNGPEMAFRAAEEHGLREKYGTRILISIASGLEMSTGRSLLATLSKEKQNWDGEVQRELNTFIAKIGGGF